jgi:hypothetical protein
LELLAMRKPLLPTLVVLASAGLLALTGCSAPAENTAAEDAPETSTSQSPATEESPAAAAGDQSVEESCAVASEAMASVQSEMSGAMQSMGAGDIASVIPALKQFEASLGEAVDQVANPEVGAALSDFQSGFASFNAALAPAETGGIEAVDQNALQTSANDLQTSAQEIQALCS